MGFENVGRVWTPQTLKDYLASLAWPSWCKAVTLHHCAAPSLAQRPNGFTAQHMKNIEDFYRRKPWASGPHLFADDDQLWGMSDLRKPGIHAVSFNSMSVGIEVLGDYDIEDPRSGRGLACWKTAAAGTKALLAWLGVSASRETVLFHNDDPQTTKTCPGKKVKKDWVLGLIEGARIEGARVREAKPDIGVTLQSDQWRFIGERWCVPVRVFLLKKNVPETEIATKLKKVGKNFFYGTELLEGAFYDQDTTSTWAPTRELVDLL